MFEDELETALSRPRYARSAKPLSGDGEDVVCVSGHRHAHRSRSLLGSFGQVEIEVPRARLSAEDGRVVLRRSMKSGALPRTPNHTGERDLAHLQRFAPEVLPVQFDQVERVEEYGGVRVPVPMIRLLRRRCRIVAAVGCGAAPCASRWGVCRRLDVEKRKLPNKNN
jgi:hypothetical protein